MASSLGGSPQDVLQSCRIDCFTVTNGIIVTILTTRLDLQYFKSIEQVASSQGFTQVLPDTAHTRKKRDSIVSQLDSPKSPKAMSSMAHFLLPPTPTASPHGSDTADRTDIATGLGAEDIGAGNRGILRSVTPELVPDRMADRLPVTPLQEKGLNGLVPGELPIQRMGTRVD